MNLAVLLYNLLCKEIENLKYYMDKIGDRDKELQTSKGKKITVSER